MVIDGILSLCREHPVQASAPSMRLLRSSPHPPDEGEAALSGWRATGKFPRETASAIVTRGLSCLSSLTDDGCPCLRDLFEAKLLARLTHTGRRHRRAIAGICGRRGGYDARSSVRRTRR